MLSTTSQSKPHANRVHELMESAAFHRDSDEEGPWKAAFIEMINVVDDLLSRSEKQGNRVDFIDGVGVNGKIQDITSLVGWMGRRLPELTADLPGQLPGNHLNRYFDQGTGYFANGYFFTSDFNEELAFFVDDQRIYLKHHIERAVREAEQYLQTTKKLA